MNEILEEMNYLVIALQDRINYITRHNLAAEKLDQTCELIEDDMKRMQNFINMLKTKK